MSQHLVANKRKDGVFTEIKSSIEKSLRFR